LAFLIKPIDRVPRVAADLVIDDQGPSDGERGRNAAPLIPAAAAAGEEIDRAVTIEKRKDPVIQAGDADIPVIAQGSQKASGAIGSGQGRRALPRGEVPGRN
jgi:hypothetical protein